MFRIYISDVVMCMAEGWGNTISMRYVDLITEPTEEEPPTKSGDEIALEVIERLGLKGKSNGFYEVESDPVA